MASGSTSSSEPTLPKVDKNPEPKQTTPEPEPEELGLASFVDKSKDPQSYVNRYNNETSYKKWFDEYHSNYSSIYQAVGLKKPVPKSKLKNHYMLTTSVAALLTAAANLVIICWMNATDKLDLGLGLAAIGLITFFGVSLSSSIFEEHRHEHGHKKKSNLISNVIVGKGIMRKGLAASLVMTYIVLIGLSFSSGDLNNSWVVDTETKGPSEDTKTPTTDETSSGTPNSQDDNVDIEISDIVTLGSLDNKLKSVEASILAKESNSLVQHFTIVISLVVGFYFSANFLTAYINARKENKTSDDPLEILKVRLAKGEIKEKKYEDLKALIKK